jgi:predicted MPP superfamily phosphohydrolase
LNEERKPATEITAGLDKSRPLIFLNHQPSDFREDEEAGADLVLTGHTHKGQFFPGNLFTVNIFKSAGATHYGYMKGRSAQLLVTSGAGVWGPPLRIASNSEVAVINITNRN